MQPQVAVYYESLRSVYGRPAGRRPRDAPGNAPWNALRMVGVGCELDTETGGIDVTRRRVDELNRSAKESESEETCRYSIQKTPPLERSTLRSSGKPAVAWRSSSVLLVTLLYYHYSDSSVHFKYSNTDTTTACFPRPSGGFR